MKFPEKFVLYNKGVEIYECEWWFLPRLIEAMQSEYDKYMEDQAIQKMEGILNKWKAEQEHRQQVEETLSHIRRITKLLKDWDTRSVADNKETK